MKTRCGKNILNFSCETAGMKLITAPALVRIGVSLSLLLVVSIWYVASIVWMPGESYTGAPLPLSEEEEEGESRLRADVELLCDLAPRDFTNPSSLENAASILLGRFLEMGYSARLQPVPSPPWLPTSPGSSRPQFWNVVAEKAGSSLQSEIIVIGAHYDTDVETGGPGADDNASGVASLLEVARLLSTIPTSRTVRFVAFVNEEPPFFRTEFMGSMEAARVSRSVGEDIRGMLSLEMVGYYSELPHSQKYPYPLEWLLGKFYPDRGNFVAFVSDRASRPLLVEALRSFRDSVPFPSEGAALPGWVTGVDWSDHSSYWAHGYPALMVTDTSMFRNYRYHTRLDTPDTLDYGRMSRVCVGLSEVVGHLSSPSPLIESAAHLRPSASEGRL